jgi:hypothetical protein
VAVGDEDVSVRRHGNLCRLIEGVGARASDARLAESQQHLSVCVELDHLLATALDPAVISDPDEPLAVDRDFVRADEQACPEALEKLSRRVELQNRIER